MILPLPQPHEGHSHVALQAHTGQLEWAAEVTESGKGVWDAQEKSWVILYWNYYIQWKAEAQQHTEHSHVEISNLRGWQSFSVVYQQPEQYCISFEGSTGIRTWMSTYTGGVPFLLQSTIISPREARFPDVEKTLNWKELLERDIVASLLSLGVVYSMVSFLDIEAGFSYHVTMQSMFIGINSRLV